MKSIYSLLTGLIITSCLQSQGQSILSGKPIANAPTREADVMWMKRVWRRIDVRQKINQPYFFQVNGDGVPKALFDHLLSAIEDQTITAYNPGPLGEDDFFTTPYSSDDLDSLISRSYRVKRTNPISLVDEWVEVQVDIGHKDILFYEIKEDWYFDKQRSVMDVSIVGLCPVMAIYDETTGVYRGVKRLFWIDMSTSREVMDQWIVFNRNNDQEMRTFDEMFQKRIFSSYIIKESNVYDRYINEYAFGADALFESDRIQNEILAMEHDLWSH